MISTAINGIRGEFARWANPGAGPRPDMSVRHWSECHLFKDELRTNA